MQNLKYIAVIHSQSAQLSEQGIKDNKKLELRLQRVRPLYHIVRDFINKSLCYPNRGKVLKFASLISEKIHINIDRLAKRVSDGTICWFCENWREMQPYISECLKELNEGTEIESKKKTLKVKNKRPKPVITLKPVGISSIQTERSSYEKKIVETGEEYKFFNPSNFVLMPKINFSQSIIPKVTSIEETNRIMETPISQPIIVPLKSNSRINPSHFYNYV